MRQYVSQYSARDLGRLMGMPGKVAMGINHWELNTLSPADWDGTESILAVDNVGGSQAAGEPINADWEALIENGSGSNGHFEIEWDNRNDASWVSNGKGPNGLIMESNTGNSTSRLTIQTDTGIRHDLTDTDVACMMIICRNIRTTTATSEIYIGLGGYTQNTTFHGGPNVRSGSLSTALLGSSNTLTTAYDDAGTGSGNRTYFYDDNVSNSNFPFNRKNGDTIGAFVWRSPANASQSTTDWLWRGGGMFNNRVWAYSASQISGKAVTVEDAASLDTAQDWGGFVTMRGQENSTYFSFQSLELWVGYF